MAKIFEKYTTDLMFRTNSKKKRIMTALSKIDSNQNELDLAELIAAYCPKSLVIVINDRDDVVASYDNQIINTRIKKSEGFGKKRILRILMNTRKEDKKSYQTMIDQFLLIIDGIVWNLAKGHKVKKRDDNTKAKVAIEEEDNKSIKQ